MHKKYIVDYCSGSTGYGWTQEYDRLDEFEEFIDECRHTYSAKVRVFDTTLGKYIFWKGCSWKPETDMLGDIVRDMRTSDRKMKRHTAAQFTKTSTTRRLVIA